MKNSACRFDVPLQPTSTRSAYSACSPCSLEEICAARRPEGCGLLTESCISRHLAGIRKASQFWPSRRLSAALAACEGVPFTLIASTSKQAQASLAGVAIFCRSILSCSLGILGQFYRDGNGKAVKSTSKLAWERPMLFMACGSCSGRDCRGHRRGHCGGRYRSSCWGRRRGRCRGHCWGSWGCWRSRRPGHCRV